MNKFVAPLTGALLAASAAAGAGAAPTDAVRDLAPNGRLRAAINFGNPVLAQKDPATGEPCGVSAALARELGRQLGVPVDFVTFTEAGQVFAALKDGAWDISFLAIDPVRAAEIGFTAAYVVIEGTYAVPAGSPLQRVEDVDRDGVHIAVAQGSAYDLFLTRTLKHAELVRAANSAAAVALLEQDKVEVLAGVKQPLLEYAKSHPAVRVLPGRFMEIQQAMGTPKARAAGIGFLKQFVETMKASGFVARELAASGQGDATVAPPAAAP
ncbi:MAG TPA: ABC transporter substrate-binding protein [Aliidongia sp.]|nr:ABC transporter substrate-binding protein [Aliidongia sp.]